MKKLIVILSILLIAFSLYAGDEVPSVDKKTFTLWSQVEGVLFHGFTTKGYNNSDDLLEANTNDATWNASTDKVNLTIDENQFIGSYIFYSTNNSQSDVTFETYPLSLTVYKKDYYVPYALDYKEKVANDISVSGQSVGSAAQAFVSKIEPKPATDIVLKTNDKSSGARYGILDLYVTFKGSENIKFGLPEASDKAFYRGTIVAKVVSRK
ncbi:MAG: hypothetical protein EOM67_10810 [Spirochaetia bacterium]|nr:hypothetical protein [Spirochaetia bacterium]